ncbi:DUF2779 domain-containing protein [Pseudoxanthomonas mexicana]|uniref:DUF2779 domain-containing protein n=1 Tax=Pseudoxanthomonas mexicana TaxID=128785 RepID=UPI00398B84A3
MRHLTKSRFTLALECPTKLAYLDDPRYANANRHNDFLMALAEGGHQVGALAKCLFPDGIEVDAQGHDAQVAQTMELLQRSEVLLFEAAIRVGNLFIRVDLLRKSESMLELYEVKAKGFDPSDHYSFIGKRNGFTSDMKSYLYDVAFQRYVLRQTFPDMTIRSHLVMPNKSAVCSTDGMAQKLRIVRNNGRVSIDIDPSLQDGASARELLSIISVDALLDRLVNEPLDLGRRFYSFKEGIEALSQSMDGEHFPPRLGVQCRSCEFRASPAEKAAGSLDGRMTCLKAIDPRRAHMAENGKATVFDLYRFRRTDMLVDEGKLLLQDVETEDLKFKTEDNKISSSHRQWLQVKEDGDAIKAPHIIERTLKGKLDSLIWPLHFIDFETSRPALPFHAGRRPYEQLLFQFSHHMIEADGSIRHQSQYLAEAGDGMPNFDTLRALKQALEGDNGSVLHWWDHERTVLKDVCDQLQAVQLGEVPDRDALITFIQSLLGTTDALGRLFDLGRLVENCAFFPGTGGSSSLKKVLPALLMGSEELRGRYLKPNYGAPGGILSLNFQGQAWIQLDLDGNVIDPYKLLGQRVDDPDLPDLEELEDDGATIANGGAAMVAYGLLQNDLLSVSDRKRLRAQLLRYCELDTLAMVMAWQGLQGVFADA